MKEREVVTAALALSAASRAMIIKTLTDSLLNDAPECVVGATDVESAWYAEAEDRVLAFERGEIEAVPGDQVIRDLRARSRG